MHLLERRALEAKLAMLPAPEPGRLVMVEVALYKGYRDASVVLDTETRRVLWIGEGRSREAVRPSSSSWGTAGLRPYRGGGHGYEHCLWPGSSPVLLKARVVYDLCHVLAKYGRKSSTACGGCGQSAAPR